MQKDDMRNHIQVQVGELQSRSGKERDGTEGMRCLRLRTLQTVDAVLTGLVGKPAKSLMTWRFADDATALEEVEQQNGVGKLQTDLKFGAMKRTAGEIPLVKSIRIKQKKVQIGGLYQNQLVVLPNAAKPIRSPIAPEVIESYRRNERRMPLASSYNSLLPR